MRPSLASIALAGAALWCTAASGETLDEAIELARRQVEEAELPEVATEGMPLPLKVKLLYDEDMLYALTDPVFLVPPDPAE